MAKPGMQTSNFDKSSLRRLFEFRPCFPGCDRSCRKARNPCKLSNRQPHPLAQARNQFAGNDRLILWGSLLRTVCVFNRAIHAKIPVLGLVKKPQLTLDPANPSLITYLGRVLQNCKQKSSKIWVSGFEAA